VEFKAMTDLFRDWRPDDWFDKNFLLYVPALDRKVFVRKVHPLTDVLAKEVEHSLFVGIKHPLHYTKTSGWVKRLIQKGFVARNVSTFTEAMSEIRRKITWPESDVILMVYYTAATYAMKWESFVLYFEKGFFNLDNPIVCHPSRREAMLFWEADCRPFVGQRGSRELPAIPWDLPSVPWQT
jgi:hypothetical protein